MCFALLLLCSVFIVLFFIHPDIHPYFLSPGGLEHLSSFNKAGDSRREDN